jgi:hypothetical protein
MGRFRINEPNVVFEAFDEEIVVVNLDSGNYYSVRGGGPVIWMALAAGASEAEVATALAGRPGTIGQDLETVVAAFANELAAAELLVRDDGRTSDDTGFLHGDAPFQLPVIESYHDMQDLLMLDPIHDVDTAGWPITKGA